MTLYAILSAPYNYFRGSLPKERDTNEADIGSDIGIDDFEYIKTDEEKRAEIMALADKVFIPTVYDEVTYSYETLTMGGTIRGDNPIPFASFLKKFYRRTCEQVQLFFNRSSNPKALSECIIKAHYGNKGGTPTQHLQARLAEKDPVALLMSAMLFQLGDHANMCPPIPDKDLLSSLDGQAVAIPFEVGHIDIDLKTLNKFTINSDVVVITEMDRKTIIGGYEVNRTVEIGHPNADGSVECKISRTFNRVYPISDV